MSPSWHQEKIVTAFHGLRMQNLIPYQRNNRSLGQGLRPMERLGLIVEQLEECRRLILIGRVPQLRMALLLSDNATEILMHRALWLEFEVSRWNENLAKQLEELPPHPDPEFADDIYGSIVTAAQRKKIERFFDEKVKFLSVDRSKIEPSVASALTSIHRYRNAAYHEEKLQKGSINAIALLSFDIATSLLVTLPSAHTTWEPRLDYSWLTKYGLPTNSVVSPELTKIRDVLCDGLPLAVEGLRSELMIHLRQRLASVFRCLDYLIENVSWSKNQEEAFKLSQYNATLQPGQVPGSYEEYVQFVPKYFLADLDSWNKEVGNLILIGDKPALFAEFARLDKFFEPLEFQVREAAQILDGAIQAAMDRARGK